MLAVGSKVVDGQGTAVQMVPQAVAIPGAAADINTKTNSGISDYLGNGVILSQHTSECCRCCCCQPNIDWDLTQWTEEIETLGRDRKSGGAYEKIQASQQLAFVKEDAPYCGRVCSYMAPGHRETTYTYHKGADTSGEVLMKHSKGCTNGVNQVILITDNGPVRCPCCCFLPYLATHNANDELMGTSRYICDTCLFVPKFHVEDSSGRVQYYVRPDTCFFGCCVLCKCGDKGAKCCRIPFYIRDPQSKEKLDAPANMGKAEMVDLWAGWKAECCTRRDLYELKFPTDVTPELKMTLLGLTHLVDITVFEQDE